MHVENIVQELLQRSIHQTRVNTAVALKFDQSAVGWALAQQYGY